MHFLLIAYVSLVISTTSLAGGDIVGNGGDILICSHANGPDSYELLDYFEAKNVRKETLSFPKGDDYLQVARALIARAKVLDPFRFELFNRHLLNSNLIEFIGDAHFEDVNDSSHLPIPRNCEIKQIAIQTKNKISIDLSLWNRLSTIGKSGLILHELIYWDALRHGHSNSLIVRYMNGLLASDAISQMSSEDYASILSQTSLDQYYFVDTKVGRKWLLSRELINTQENAESFCEENGYQLVYLPDLDPKEFVHMSHSHWGKYFLSELSPLKVWAKPGSSGKNSLKIYPFNVTAAFNDAPVAALCQKPNPRN